MRLGLGAASPGSVLTLPCSKASLQQILLSTIYFSELILLERVARLLLAILDSVQDYIVTQSSGNHAQALQACPKFSEFNAFHTEH
jgi:hypothetical protein